MENKYVRQIIDDSVKEQLENKLSTMPEDARNKIQKALQKSSMMEAVD